jgi:hypothetical protein
MAEGSERETNGQRELEDWLAKPGARDTPLERMAREAVHQHRAAETEPFPSE